MSHTAVPLSPVRISDWILKPYVLAVALSGKAEYSLMRIIWEIKANLSFVSLAPLSLSLLERVLWRGSLSGVLLWAEPWPPKCMWKSQSPVPGTVFGLRTFKEVIKLKRGH